MSAKNRKTVLIIGRFFAYDGRRCHWEVGQ